MGTGFDGQNLVKNVAHHLGSFRHAHILCRDFAVNVAVDHHVDAGDLSRYPGVIANGQSLGSHVAFDQLMVDDSELRAAGVLVAIFCASRSEVELVFENMLSHPNVLCWALQNTVKHYLVMNEGASASITTTY